VNFHRVFPFLNWPRLRGAQWRIEVQAGLNVALVLVPQSVAYAALAGMPLVTGLYATLLPALIAALFSASSRLSVGPTALSSLLVFASLTGLAEPASAHWVTLAVWLALLAGLLQWSLGVLGYGWLLNLISSPVLMGFTQAATLLIIASQIPALLGGQGSFVSWVIQPEIDTTATLYGVVTMAALWLGKRWLPRWPVMLVAVVVACVVSDASGFSSAHKHLVIGTLPSSLPSLQWPDFPGLGLLAQLLVPAAVIALVSFLETASSAKVESRLSGKRWDDNQDLIGQGLAKIASGLSGSFATSSSFSRSAINMLAGAQSGWSTVVMVLAVTLCLPWLIPALYHVPLSVLSAVVIVAVMGLVKPAELFQLARISRVEAITAIITFAVTLATAPRIYWGVLAGVIISLTHFLYQHLHPRIIEIGLHPDGSLRDRHLWKLPPLAPKLYALRMDDELDFASASVLERNVLDHLAAHPGVQHVCLFAQPINRIDITGIETLQRITATLHERNIHLHISGIKLPVETMLRKAGALGEHPLLHLYRVDADTLTALRKLDMRIDFNQIPDMGTES
jgi:sulfate permease, SulP family